MNILSKTVETGQATVEKSIEAAKGTSKTFFWILASTIVGAVTALLADPQVVELLRENPKVVLWIPIVNVLLVFAKKFFEEK